MIYCSRETEKVKMSGSKLEIMEKFANIVNGIFREGIADKEEIQKTVKYALLSDEELREEAEKSLDKLLKYMEILKAMMDNKPDKNNDDDLFNSMFKDIL